MVEIEGWQTVDESGLNMPWYTRPCLAWLQTIDLKGKKIFEYGVGNSTKWYESKGATVWGVDSSEQWANFAGAHYTQNKNEYIQEINNPCLLNVKFDIICIDGLFRDECTEHALKRIKNGGHIIIDNYKQPSVEEFWPITEVLIKDMNTVLYKEPKHYDWQTLVIHVL